MSIAEVFARLGETLPFFFSSAAASNVGSLEVVSVACRISAGGSRSELHSLPCSLSTIFLIFFPPSGWLLLEVETVAKSEPLVA